MAGSPWADFNSFMSRSVSHISLMSHSVMPAAIAVPNTGATFAGSDDALRLAVWVTPRHSFVGRLMGIGK